MGGPNAIPKKIVRTRHIGCWWWKKHTRPPFNGSQFNLRALPMLFPSLASLPTPQVTQNQSLLFPSFTMKLNLVPLHGASWAVLLPDLSKTPGLLPVTA